VASVLGQQLHVAVAQAADPEFMKVIVPPVEGGLNGKMQLLKSPVRRQYQSAPDLRLDLVE
jgi:hypothetical protein